MHVLCCPDRNYYPYTGVMLSSLLASNRGTTVDIWVVTPDSSAADELRLKALCGRRGCHLHLIHVSSSLMDSLPEGKGLWSKAAYLRILALDLLPPEVDRVIYLDGDIIVNADLRPLWEAHLDDSQAAAAVTDINDYIMDSRSRLGTAAPYFNSGMMLFDLAACRRMRLAERCLEILSARELDYPDQDALNIALDGHVAYQDLRWNFVSDYMLTDNQRALPEDVRREVKAIMSGHRDAVIHYTGERKPWCGDLFYFHPLTRLWERHYRRSPWRGEDLCGRRKMTMRSRFALRRLKLVHALGIRLPYHENLWIPIDRHI